MHAMKRDEVQEALSQLQRKLGAQAVLLGADVPARNGNDWSASLPQSAARSRKAGRRRRCI